MNQKSTDVNSASVRPCSFPAYSRFYPQANQAEFAPEMLARLALLGVSRCFAASFFRRIFWPIAACTASVPCSQFFPFSGGAGVFSVSPASSHPPYLAYRAFSGRRRGRSTGCTPHVSGAVRLRVSCWADNQRATAIFSSFEGSGRAIPADGPSQHAAAALGGVSSARKKKKAQLLAFGRGGALSLFILLVRQQLSKDSAPLGMFSSASSLE